MAAIFISYRRSDSGGHAGRLFDRLSHWFDADALFYDRKGIALGNRHSPATEHALTERLYKRLCPPVLM